MVRVLGDGKSETKFYKSDILGGVERLRANNSFYEDLPLYFDSEDDLGNKIVRI